MVTRLDEVYRARGILAALYGTLVRLNAASESDRLRPGMSLENPAHRNGDDEMERRAALHLLAGLGTLGISGEPLRQLLDLSLDRIHRRLTEWEMSCSDHLHALRTRPPAQVATDLLVDLFAIRRQLGTATAADAIELQRFLAVLASVHANALTRLGDHGAAIRWWRTAREAADASGDLELRLLVRGEEAGHGLYGQRAPETVLRLVEQAQRLAGGPNVDLMTTQAKALSMLGRNDEALATLRTLRRQAENGFVLDRYGFSTASRVYFTESWVYAAAGDESAADTAREHVLKISRDYQYPANVQLHGAQCAVVRGGIDQGLLHASATIAALAPAYRSRHIIETGKLVLAAVPRDDRHRPTVVEFRELLIDKTAGTSIPM
jgi:hypothetical protein